MLDSATPHSTRVRAADSVLNHAAKAIDRRLSKLEDRFGIADDRERVVVTLDGAGSKRALSNDICIQILDEAGLLHTGGFGLVDLTKIPNGLSAKETERFLRENGAQLCGSRPAQSPRGPGDGGVRQIGPTGLNPGGTTARAPEITVRLS
jgi:hypothetical protein